MVPLKHTQLFLPSIGIVQPLAVVQFNKRVVLAVGCADAVDKSPCICLQHSMHTKQCWDVGFAHMVHRRHIVNVEPCTFTHAAPQHVDGHFEHCLGDTNLLLLHELHHQVGQAAKGTVKHLC